MVRVGVWGRACLGRQAVLGADFWVMMGRGDDVMPPKNTLLEENKTTRTNNTTRTPTSTQHHAAFHATHTHTTTTSTHIYNYKFKSPPVSPPVSRPESSDARDTMAPM